LPCARRSINTRSTPDRARRVCVCPAWGGIIGNLNRASLSAAWITNIQSVAPFTWGGIIGNKAFS
jgi:hypothetical protein